MPPPKVKGAKGKEPQKRKPKKIKMTLTPVQRERIPASDASTLPYDNSEVMVPDTEEILHNDSDLEATGVSDMSAFLRSEGGGVHSEVESDTDLSDEELGFRQRDPLRHDIPINRGRWDKEELGALMNGININREAIKFHFDGAGGGKDVKRQGWVDVARHVNDTANTHRTVKQCRDKVSDYTQNAKKKYNKLRYEVNQTGRGHVSKKLLISVNQEKALDYLRQEAVKGIPGIGEMDLTSASNNVPCKENIALLWEPERERKPDYTIIKMERKGVPNNYKDKNNRRRAREAKVKRQQENEKKQKALRKAEISKKRKEEREERRQDRQDRRERKEERKMKRAERNMNDEIKKKRAAKERKDRRSQKNRNKN